LTPPDRVFPVHGENQALDEMRLRLRDRFDWDVRIPRLNETFDWTPSQT
jgi:predicted metal-dependent RNase